MQLHSLQGNTKNKDPKRVGRGGKRGTNSGKGTKGQKKHGGRAPRPEIRDTIKKIPKLRGYKFNPINPKPQPVSLASLEAHFEKGEAVSPKTLLAKGLVRRQNGKLPKVKVLGQGELTKPLALTNVQISKTALEQVSKAGGSVS